MMKTNLFIISGPSASGKNTVLGIALGMCKDSIRAITHTTRAPRSEEKHGVDYYFVSNEDFDALSASGGLVESNCYDGNCYGLSREELSRVMSRGFRNVFAILDVNGERNVKLEYPDAVSIFILPPSMEELKSRIEGRRENTSEQIRGRMAIAENEMLESERYDYRIVNRDKNECANELLEIIRSCGGM